MFTQKTCLEAITYCKSSKWKSVCFTNDKTTVFAFDIIWCDYYYQVHLTVACFCTIQDILFQITAKDDLSALNIFFVTFGVQ